MVLTGGTSALTGIEQVASEVLNMHVRTAQPENLKGLADRLNSPAFATSVGLLHWAVTMHEHEPSSYRRDKRRRSKGENNVNLNKAKDWIKRLLP